MKKRIIYITALSAVSLSLFTAASELSSRLTDRYTLEVASSFPFAYEDNNSSDICEYSEIFTVKAGDELYETTDRHWILNPGKNIADTSFGRILEISKTLDNRLILKSNGKTISGLCGSKMKIESTRTEDLETVSYSYMIGFSKI